MGVQGPRGGGTCFGKNGPSGPPGAGGTRGGAHTKPSSQEERSNKECIPYKGKNVVFLWLRFAESVSASRCRGSLDDGAVHETPTPDETVGTRINDSESLGRDRTPSVLGTPPRSPVRDQGPP